MPPAHVDKRLKVKVWLDGPFFGGNQREIWRTKKRTENGRIWRKPGLIETGYGPDPVWVLPSASDRPPDWKFPDFDQTGHDLHQRQPLIKFGSSLWKVLTVKSQKNYEKVHKTGKNWVHNWVRISMDNWWQKKEQFPKNWKVEWLFTLTIVSHSLCPEICILVKKWKNSWWPEVIQY